MHRMCLACFWSSGADAGAFRVYVSTAVSPCTRNARQCRRPRWLPLMVPSLSRELPGRVYWLPDQHDHVLRPPAGFWGQLGPGKGGQRLSLSISLSLSFSRSVLSRTCARRAGPGRRFLSLARDLERLLAAERHVLVDAHLFVYFKNNSFAEM